MYIDPPKSVRSLEQRIRNLERTLDSALRRRTTMALVIAGQMLPEGAVKGGGFKETWVNVRSNLY